MRPEGSRADAVADPQSHEQESRATNSVSLHIPIAGLRKGLLSNWKEGIMVAFARRQHHSDPVFLALVFFGCLLLQPVAAAGTDLFFDDFESYAVGTLPAVWELVYNGRGTSWQVVTDDEAASGSHSLRLWGRPGWSAVADRHFATDSPLIGYRFAILIESGGVMYAEHPSFFKFRAENYWGTYYAVVYFEHLTSEIQAEDGTPLGTWVPGIWHHVCVLLDRTTHTYTLWIDGQKLGEELSILYQHPEWIDALALTSAHGGVPVYYDDVAVYVPEAAEVIGLLAEQVKALVASQSLNSGQGKALLTKLEHVWDRVGEGRTRAASNQLRAFIHQVEDLVSEGVLLVAEGDRLIRYAELTLEQL